MTRGKSGQHRERQSLTATGGNSRESATETKLPSRLCKRLVDWKDPSSSKEMCINTLTEPRRVFAG